MFSPKKIYLKAICIILLFAVLITASAFLSGCNNLVKLPVGEDAEINVGNGKVKFTDGYWVDDKASNDNRYVKFISIEHNVFDGLIIVRTDEDIEIFYYVQEDNKLVDYRISHDGYRFDNYIEYFEYIIDSDTDTMTYLGTTFKHCHLNKETQLIENLIFDYWGSVEYPYSDQFGLEMNSSSRLSDYYKYAENNDLFYGLETFQFLLKAEETKENESNLVVRMPNLNLVSDQYDGYEVDANNDCVIVYEEGKPYLFKYNDASNKLYCEEKGMTLYNITAFLDDSVAEKEVLELDVVNMN